MNVIYRVIKEIYVEKIDIIWRVSGNFDCFDCFLRFVNVIILEERLLV